MNTPQTQFLLAEYDALRREIDEKIRQSNSLPKYTALATAAIWTWLYSNNVDSVVRIVTWIPACLTVLLGVLDVAMHRDIIRAGEYIRRVEKHLNLPEGLGWEGYIRGQSWTRIPKVLFWLALLAANCVAALIGLVHAA